MSVDQELYPLGHSATELGRLELQAKLFEDPLLIHLAQEAESCLEIGSGIGSNWPSLQRANSTLRYEGIDLSETAVTKANSIHGGGRANFSVASATSLPFRPCAFDLVVSKLVLWSMGPAWKTALREAYRVLRPGGLFYAFEPYDQGVVFEPARPAFREVLEHWGQAASLNGIDLCLGPKVPEELILAGFKNVQTFFFPVLAPASDPERFQAICDNLGKFYLGESSREFLKDLNPRTLLKASEELLAAPHGLVMDAFFVTVGEKCLDSVD